MGSGADAAIEAADVVFMNSNMDAIPQAIALANKTGAVAMQKRDLCDWNQSNRYDLRTDRNLYQYVVSSIRRYRCCILMYFEFDPNFTSEIIEFIKRKCYTPYGNEVLPWQCQNAVS